MIYLVASAATAWDDQGRLQGSMDLPPSVTGRQTAGRIAALWKSGVIRAVHHGPDEASRLVASLLAQAHQGRHKSNEGLAEVNLGLWQGLTETELEDRYPTAYGQWREDPGSVMIPEGEDLEHARQRYQAAVARIVGRSGDHPVVLVLRPVIRRLIARWLGGDYDADQPLLGIQITAERWQQLKKAPHGRKVSV